MGLVHQWASWSLSTQVVRMSVTMKKSPSRVTICCKQGDLPFFLQQYCIYENDQILYRPAVPNVFGTRNLFCGIYFFHGWRLGWGRRGRDGLGGDASDGKWWEAENEAVFVHLPLTSCSADLGRNRAESIGNYNIRRRRRRKTGKHLLIHAEMSWRAAWGISNRGGL